MVKHMCKADGCLTQARRDSTGKRLFCLFHSRSRLDEYRATRLPRKRAM